MPLTYYAARSDGKWHHLGGTLPDENPGPSDPDPPVQGDLWFGRTLIGQSSANYKKFTLSGESDRYKQVEYDTVYDLGGSLGVKRGGAVMRSFGPTSQIGTWSTMTGGYFRAHQPVIYSFKDGNNYDGKTESQFKQSIRDFIDSRPVGSTARVWLTFAHEFDNDKAPGGDDQPEGTATFWGLRYNGVGMSRYYARNLWIREVLEGEGGSQYAEASYRNGGWLKFGPIVTGTPFQHGRSPSSDRAWNQYHDAMSDYAGRDDVWDFWGCDKYNPKWDGDDANRYMLWADWSKKFTACNQQTGLPIVIAECGSARDTRSMSVALRDADRAAWLANQYVNMIESGMYDCATYWRVPAVKGTTAQQINNPFSTQMICPTGENAAMLPDVMANGGPDAQAVCDVHHEHALRSIAEANAISGNPQIPYYTGGPA